MDEYLFGLCYQYINAIEQGIEGDFYRGQIHKLIERYTGIDRDKLKEILHNLDKVIGYTFREHNEYEIRGYAQKLYDVLEKEK